MMSAARAGRAEQRNDEASRKSAPGAGLVFFAKDASPQHRRRRLTLVAILLLAALSLIWPVYPFFSGIYPLLFGLPLSLVWPTLWLGIVFAALLWLFLSEQ